MTQDGKSQPTDGQQTIAVREVVAIFDDGAALENAIEVVEQAGVNRGAISVIASDETFGTKLSHVYRSVSEMDAHDDIARGVKVTRYELAEGQGAAFSIPVYVGATAGLIAVLASGGTVGLAALAGLAAGAAGGGIGVSLARLLGDQQAQHVQQQIEEGGLLLWVQVKDAADADARIDQLKSLGGRDVRVHVYQRPWGDDAAALASQPDPLLRE